MPEIVIADEPEQIRITREAIHFTLLQTIKSREQYGTILRAIDCIYGEIFTGHTLSGEPEKDLKIMSKYDGIEADFLHIIFASQYWEITGHNELQKHYMGKFDDSGDAKKRAEHILDSLDKKVLWNFENKKVLFKGILEEEAKGERILASNLPLVGILKPLVYNSISRREFGKEVSAEQLLMERVLGTKPPYFEKAVSALVEIEKQDP